MKPLAKVAPTPSELSDRARRDFEERGILGDMLAIAARHHVLLREICSDGARGSRNVVNARREVWAHLRSLGLSFPEIARITGHDHTSVLTGLRRAAARAAS